MADDIRFLNKAADHQEELLEGLYGVIDPELGIDIVNLGLVYQVDLDEDGNCFVLMTLTTMGCPLADVIEYELTVNLEAQDCVEDVDVSITFDPPWSIERMTRFARISLGIPAPK